MLERIRGDLRDVGDHAATVTVGNLDYEVLVPTGDAARLRLSIGEPIEFVLLHYLESQSNGAVFRPRLVGFTTENACVGVCLYRSSLYRYSSPSSL